MALTVHQEFHLQAMLSGQIVDKADPEMMVKLQDANNKTESEYLSYLNGVKTEVNKILLSGVFPDLERAYMIHDYLEKR